MKTRQFGSTDIRVSELCLGTSTFARYADRDDTFAILDSFRAAEGNFFQTSGICPGASLGDGFLGLPEEFLGRWLTARSVRRSDVVIATRMAYARPLIGGDRAYGNLVRSCVCDSLRRIGTDHVDFLVLEWTDAMLPIDESIASAEAIVRAGYARAILLAPFSTAQLAMLRQQRHPTIAGIQLDHSLACRSLFEPEAARVCAAGDLGFMARSPLAGGLLVSRTASASTAPGWHRSDEPSVRAKARLLRPVLRGIARAHGVTPARIALAWVRGRSGITSVLISVRSPTHLRELLRAPSLRLPARSWNRLTALSEAPNPQVANRANTARRTSRITSADAMTDRTTN